MVTSIELLNEPLPNGGSFLDDVHSFYDSGYNKIRSINSDTVVVLHDAFQGFSSWQGYKSPNTGASHVMIDSHLYQIFDAGQISQSPSEHVSAACGLGRQLSQTDKWTVIGEWTGAQTEYVFPRLVVDPRV